MEQRRGGPSLAPPPTGLGRARSVTLSLCRRSSAVSCAVAPVAAAPVAALADAGAMAATDIARQVVSAGLGCRRRGRGPGKGGGDLAAATAAARAAGSIRSQGAAGLLLPGSAAHSPSLSPRALVAGGWGGLAEAAGRQLNLHCPRAAVSAAASLAAAAAAPLGRCRMNGRTGRRALGVPDPQVSLPPAVGPRPCVQPPPGTRASCGRGARGWGETGPGGGEW